MKKNIKVNWYIFILSLFVMVFSTLCWIGFFKNEGLNTIVEHKNFARVESKWYESMFHKKELSEIDSKITYRLLGEISSSQVIKGYENWLFYKSKTDGDPIADYEGTNLYSQEEKEKVVENVYEAQKVCESRGTKFAVLIAPNKEHIYSEYMPDTYIHAKTSNTDMLIDYLQEQGINAVSPKEELEARSEAYQLYYSYDTHWNQLGAYIGVRETLLLWDIEIPDIETRKIETELLRDNYHYCAEDDLAQMVGLRDIFDDEVEYKVNGTGLMDWGRFEEEQENNQVSYYTNSDAQINASIFLIGDSFRTAMVPVLREVFSEVYVVHRNYCTSEIVKEVEPDYLLVEYVERYADSIKNMNLFIE